MFAMHIRPEVLKRLREEYPPGCTVELIEMNIHTAACLPDARKGHARG